jgi:tRNA(Ile)-lysidine synthase TilS/MesJ
MKAHYINQEGDIRIIRPFVYVRETQTAAFAKSVGLPVIPDSCPACFSTPTQREHMKMLLATEERCNKQLFASLLQAMRPLMMEPPQRALLLDDGKAL